MAIWDSKSNSSPPKIDLPKRESSLATNFQWRAVRFRECETFTLPGPKIRQVHLFFSGFSNHCLLCQGC